MRNNQLYISTKSMARTNFCESDSRIRGGIQRGGGLYSKRIKTHSPKLPAEIAMVMISEFNQGRVPT